MTQMLAREQLRCREKLMRKPKEDQPVPTPVEEKKAIVPVKRKANPTETSVAKKARPVTFHHCQNLHFSFLFRFFRGTEKYFR